MIPSGDAEAAKLRCRLCVDATADKVSSGEPCSFQLYGPSWTSLKGLVKVSTGELVHSCPKVVRRARERSGVSRVWSLCKIAEFEKAIAEGKSLPERSSWRRPGVLVETSRQSRARRSSEGGSADTNSE